MLYLNVEGVTMWRCFSEWFLGERACYPCNTGSPGSKACSTVLKDSRFDRVILASDCLYLANKLNSSLLDRTSAGYMMPALCGLTRPWNRSVLSVVLNKFFLRWINKFGKTVTL
ncbi:hypothetical protein VPH35_019893 [Triticum aestivum]